MNNTRRLPLVAMHVPRLFIAGGPFGRLNLAHIAILARDTQLAKAEQEKLSWLGNKFPAQSEVVQLLKGVQ